MKVTLLYAINPTFRGDLEQARIDVATYESQKQSPQGAANEAFRLTNAPADVLSDDECDLQNKLANQIRGKGTHFSMSVGDAVDVDGEVFVCQFVGWTKK